MEFNAEDYHNISVLLNRCTFQGLKEAEAGLILDQKAKHALEALNKESHGDDVPSTAE